MYFDSYVHIGFHVQEREIQPGQSPGYTSRRSGEWRNDHTRDDRKNVACLIQESKD